MPNEPSRLRGNAPRRTGPYPLGEIPTHVVQNIGKQLVCHLALGRTDVDGNDFADFFAKAVGGTHRGAPLGIADVQVGDCAWSIKTVKSMRPHSETRVRLIAGRNSPGYSHGISDLNASPQATGDAVLRVWNDRVDEAFASFSDLRVCVLIRNLDILEFTLFEFAAERYVPAEFSWTVNSRGNWEAADSNHIHRFTWQPHGSQFTLIKAVPPSAVKFRIRQRPNTMFTEDELLKAVGFELNWIELA